jgi:hypothetical protein
MNNSKSSGSSIRRRVLDPVRVYLSSDGRGYDAICQASELSLAQTFAIGKRTRRAIHCLPHTVKLLNKPPASVSEYMT